MRRVRTQIGTIGYFHCWTDAAMKLEDGGEYCIKRALVENEDGSMCILDPEQVTFILETAYDRKMEAVMKHLEQEFLPGPQTP